MNPLVIAIILLVLVAAYLLISGQTSLKAIAEVVLILAIIIVVIVLVLAVT